RRWRQMSAAHRCTEPMWLSKVSTFQSGHVGTAASSGPVSAARARPSASMPIRAICWSMSTAQPRLAESARMEELAQLRRKHLVDGVLRVRRQALRLVARDDAVGDKLVEHCR